MPDIGQEVRTPPWRETDRLAAVRSFGILDSEPETVFDDLVRIAAEVCDAPAAALSFMDRDRQWFKAAVGLKVQEAPLEGSFCIHAIHHSDVFIIPDAAQDPRFREAPQVVRGAKLRFYAGAVLITDEGLPLGTLFVADHRPRPDGLTSGQVASLLALSRSVIRELKFRRDNRVLSERERNLTEIADSLPQMTWIAGPDGSHECRNKRYYEFSGAAPGSIDSEGWDNLTHPDDLERAHAVWRHSTRTGEPYEAEYRVRHHSGEYRWVLARALPIRADTGVIERWIGTCTDIHKWKLAEDALRSSEERLRLAIETTGLGIWDADVSTGERQWTSEVRQILGISASTPATPETALERIHPDDRERVKAVIYRDNPNASLNVSAEYRIFRADNGEERWVIETGRAFLGEDGRPIRKLGTIQDITERKAAEEKLRLAASHDALTGLPNRVLFQERLEHALRKAQENGTSVSLLLIDLDDFKDVNDTLGHDAGDALLKETAVRLSSMIRDCDMVARLGGDEFAVLIVEPPKFISAVHLAENMIRRIRQPFPYEGRMIISRASIGVAAFPDHDAEPNELMKDADFALYRAKAEGRACVVTYTTEMRTAAEQRLGLGKQVREAMAQDQMVPFYQPKVCLSTGRIVGLECLARWLHPEKGVLTPATFGIAFDDADVATVLSKRLIGRVAADVRSWIKAGLDPGRVAVNLSSAEFSQPDLADDILRILSLAKVPTKHFEVEVTEKVLLDGRSGLVAETLEKFRRHGIQIALDDFGTGFASLRHLKQFPVDHIKIDKSFVCDLEIDSDDEAIVAAVIGLGRSLNLQVTAEGVETEGQVRWLREMGCHYAQGFFYARPMNGAIVPEFISAESKLVMAS